MHGQCVCSVGLVVLGGVQVTFAEVTLDIGGGGKRETFEPQVNCLIPS